MHRMIITRGRSRKRRTPARALLAGVLLFGGASCVPGSSLRVAPIAGALSAAPVAAAIQPVQRPSAVAAEPVSAATAFRFRAITGTDELRSLDCLTAAIYYEAASESDDGQRAVAQVVLNRVRHPGYPATVCGVVFQGPMRAVVDPLTGCQFSFTCDGSLARLPARDGWRRARRIAADALAGRVFAPAGLSTHYHADYVLPEWAPALVRTAAIGAHIFYRLPGAWGAPGAFSQRYAGGEPLPVPPPRPSPPPPMLATSLPAVLPAVLVTADPLPDVRYVDAGLPQSRVRDEYRNSGRPLAR